jgi:uncharacterized membrane-anchored protein YhcB (DUF1043 family)
MDPVKKDWLYLIIGIIVGVLSIRLLLNFFNLG